MFGNLGASTAQTQQQGNPAPSIFGNSGTSSSLFGQQTNPQQQPQGISGQPQQQQQQQQQGIFGGGLFGQTQQQPNILGQQQQTPLIGQQQQPNTLLGQTNTLLGQPQQQTTQLGQTQQQNIFGQTQQQQPQTQIAQPTTQQQPAQPKIYTMNQINQQTKIHIENLAKAIANKEKIDKNQKNLQLIEKNSLKNIQQQQQQQQITLGINQNPQQQQVQRTLVKGDRRNHTQKAENYYNEWNKIYLSISKKQDETLAQLTVLVDLLQQQDTSFDIDEESLIDSIKQLGKELDDLERKINEVVKTQEKILGLEKEESEWDQIVNNLSECLLHLDSQTKEVEDLLLLAEKNPKVQNK